MRLHSNPIHECSAHPRGQHFKCKLKTVSAVIAGSAQSKVATWWSVTTEILKFLAHDERKKQILKFLSNDEKLKKCALHILQLSNITSDSTSLAIAQRRGPPACACCMTKEFAPELPPISHVAGTLPRPAENDTRKYQRNTCRVADWQMHFVDFTQENVRYKIRSKEGRFFVQKERSFGDSSVQGDFKGCQEGYHIMCLYVNISCWRAYAESSYVQSQVTCKVYGHMQAICRVTLYASSMQSQMHMQSQFREKTDEAKDLLAYLAACIFYISVSRGLVLRTVEGSGPRDCPKARPPTASLKEQYIVRK